MTVRLLAFANVLSRLPENLRKFGAVILAGPLTAVILVCGQSNLRAAEPFQEKVVPFLKTYCVECHDGKTKKGELDLTRLSSLDKFAEEFRQWQHIVTFVKNQEMPPAKAKQPSAKERADLLLALEQVILGEARKLAGDPGMVSPRRLSNSEYDHTIHDLTGADIRPAKTFPVDPASGEGFNNTGEALTMSPNLFKKYYAAAEMVADHAIVTSTGMTFAPHPVITFADRQKFYEQAIIRFYEQHAVDYEKCLTSLWGYRRRPVARKGTTVEEWAKEAGLSPKYLRSLWDALQGNQPNQLLMGWLQQRWNALPEPKDAANAKVPAEVTAAVRNLAADLRRLSVAVCPTETKAIVSDAGNGPVNHLARRRITADSRDAFERKSLTEQRPAPKGKKDDDKATDELLSPFAAAAVAGVNGWETSGEAFCKLFPNRFFYVDSTRGLSAGFHLIEGFFRDDRPLCRSVLSDPELKELDRLWDELYFSTNIWEKMLRGFVFFERSERNFLKHADFDAFREEDPDLIRDDMLVKFKETYLKRSNVKATGDELAKHPITVFFDDVRNGLRRRATTLKQAEPLCLKELLAFNEKAYRRPLTDAERLKMETFFAEVCGDKEQGVEGAMRASIVRVLVSPHFCMHYVPTPAGDSVAALPDLALASRLGYFLWSGPPDEELLSLAKAGKLHDDKVLRTQVRRMLKDPKVSRFAADFFGQWLGYHDFLNQEAVNRQAFPAFDDALKLAMFEEPTRLITELIRQERPITELLNGDTTVVNQKLARHYGLNFRGSPDEWESVPGLRQQGRGGVLGMAVFLTKNSQPQRTSPVKRGFWVVHKLLGEHIPPPPPDVAVLPAKETDTNGKTIRELMKMHVEDMKCAGCHQRFDPVGLAMEGFDPIGRARAKDLAGRKIDNVVSLPSGKEARGIPEFGDYLAANRKQDFTKTLCQKFLGYALGRSLQLTDQPLLDKMQADLGSTNDKLSTLFELVALSPQFRNQRCRDFTPSKFKVEPPFGGEK